MLAPNITAPIEFLACRDLYFGKDLTGLDEKYMGVVMPARVKKVLSYIRATVELDRALAAAQYAMNDPNHTGPQVPYITDTKGTNVTNTLLRAFMGANIRPGNLAQERRSKVFRRRQLMADMHSEAKKGRMFNVETIRKKLQEGDF